MRGIRVWARLLGLQHTVVEDVTVGSEGEVIVAVRPSWRERDRCGRCRRRCGRYDGGRVAVAGAHWIWARRFVSWRLTPPG